MQRAYRKSPCEKCGPKRARPPPSVAQEDIVCGVLAVAPARSTSVGRRRAGPRVSRAWTEARVRPFSQAVSAVLVVGGRCRRVRKLRVSTMDGEHASTTCEDRGDCSDARGVGWGPLRMCSQRARTRDVYRPGSIGCGAAAACASAASSASAAASASAASSSVHTTSRRGTERAPRPARERCGVVAKSPGDWERERRTALS